ncbi:MULTISPECIES: alpha/beta fold hydrolase [Streptomyces]|jgi:pimeloyl-ACP methyl ester carboxylesterase|uniref:Alpha/beta fold hydrolase n=1 Tax=Streptomyces doudnae TaxID=3075536 RepID=A0ABD5EPE0_9ACTN|nr:MULTISPECIES: alpha/beta fold hydrolase [unclassified Streptomyces]MDT0435695.1 alpha/beta fold hydrolase [Streptomyces sp. DSM 41981]MYQ62648.1 alpha/beta fold hydrolase [Streptomyces sp. SID4950]SCD41377.1 Pimeloyl-ACP methyl ester carboxylesterase [Streptomyces sp. SolWspMP-5a-2]
MSATVTFDVPTPGGPRPVTVSYARVGRGAPLLLLHGIGHHRQAWDPVVDILATEREVISVDLPGFGASAALPDGLGHDLATTSRVFGALCAALGLDRPHAVGNSLGGLIALELGRAQLVRSVTVFSPAGFWSPGERRYAFGVLLTMRHIARRLPLPLVERLSRTAVGRTALTSTVYARPGRRSPEAVVAETLALAGAPGFDDTLRAGATVRFTDDVPAVPVTVAWGTRDVLLPRRQGVRAKRIIPRARLVRLPGCGHCPMNDDPALVARVILDGSR